MDTSHSEMEDPPPSPASLITRIQTIFAVFLWMGLIHFNFFILFVTFFCLPRSFAFPVLGLSVVSISIPLYEDCQLGKWVAKFVYSHATSYFPIKLVVEDETAFKPNQAYLIAAEPHSIIPAGTMMLNNLTCQLPFTTKIKFVVSSAIFYTPVIRHVWTWLGLVPATKKKIFSLLETGYSCIIIPGGIREMLVMQRDREIVFLKQRYGFIRTAIKTGTPLVPYFTFGQGHIYGWWRPNWKAYEYFSRSTGIAPMFFWGLFGSPIPRRHPLYAVLGKPIEVTKNPEPSNEEVGKVHEKFIHALEELYEKHKIAAGYKDTDLCIY
eukprot:c20760_g1_i1 orf=256-1224(-)